MTKRAQRLIDESYGLDHYLLQTPVNELYSLLGLRIKRQMLLALAGGQLPDEVMTKYQEFIVPQQVADWHGLPWTDALEKLQETERLQEKAEARPLKEKNRQELFELLKKGNSTKLTPTSWTI